MKKCFVFLFLIYFMLFIFPVATAIVEEDWENYTRIDESKRDGSGNTVTLSQVRKSYSSSEGKYTVTARDFDTQGTVVLDVSFMGRKETLILKGEWNANGTRILLTPPAVLFDDMMIITPKKIVPPTGIFTCCPEVEITIDLIRPELFLEFNDQKTTITYQPRVVNPYANWSGGLDPGISPFNESSADTETITIEEVHNAYRINEEIPVELTVTNHGDAESQENMVFIDVDGLNIRKGRQNYQLPTLAGKNQKDLYTPSSQKLTLNLSFPEQPGKLNYTIHAYVKGVKKGITYYYDTTKPIVLLPSVKLQKSVTKESMLPSRQEIERIYHSIDANEIYRWLQGGEIFVSIGVTNYQNYELKGLKLMDSPGMQLTSDNLSLNWTFDIKPSEVKEFKYKLKAQRPGTFKLPPAKLSYSDMNMTWSLFSTTPSTEVHGPCMQVYKKPDNPVVSPGSNVTINVTIRNSGDMPSRILVTDSIPGNSTLTSGSLHYEGVISPKDSVFFSYNITIKDEGQLQLPAPEIYINGRNDSSCGEPILGNILIKKPSTPAPKKTIRTPVETPAVNQTNLTNLTSSSPFQQYRFLEGLIPALMLILAVAVLMMLHRTNR